MCNYQVSIFDWPLSMLQCILYLEEAPQKLQKCYFKLYFVVCLLLLVFFSQQIRDQLFFMAIGLFPYLLSWNKEKQRLAPVEQNRKSGPHSSSGSSYHVKSRTTLRNLKISSNARETLG